MKQDKFGFIGPRTGTQLRKDTSDIFYLTIKGSVHILANDHLMDLIQLIRELDVIECECGTMLTMEEIEKHHPGCLDEWMNLLEMEYDEE